MRRVVFDLETVHLAAEVGGWKNIHLLRMSVAVLYDYLEDEYYVFREYQAEALADRLRQADLIVGYNVIRLAYRVLSYYCRHRFHLFPTLDLREDILRRESVRLSLDRLARGTLDRGREHDGSRAPEWYRQGEWDRLIDHCRGDVDLIRGIYDFGREHGFVLLWRPGSLFNHKIPVDWR